MRGSIEGRLRFRFDFFVIPSEGSGFIFGVCYFHLVAGGDSIFWLLEDVISRFAGGDGKEVVAGRVRKPSTYRLLLIGHLPYLWRWVRNLPADLRRSRSFARLPDFEGGKDGMGVLTQSLSEEQWNWIRGKKEKSEATFNDVLLGLALSAAAADRPKKIRHPRRKKIAIGSIANTRGHFWSETREDFRAVCGIHVGGACGSEWRFV